MRLVRKYLRRIRKNNALRILFFLALILFTIEACLRLWGYIAVKAITPHTNSPDLAEADYLIACFGDSYTFGVGASSSAFSYPSQLERILNIRYPNLKIRVTNEGIPGHNSSELIHRMASRLSVYPRPPDLIIVVTFSNNTWNLHQCTALREGYASLPASTIKSLIERLERAKIGKLGVLLTMRGKNFAPYLAKEEKETYELLLEKTRALLDPSESDDRLFLREWIQYDTLQIKKIAESFSSHVLFGSYHLHSVTNLIRESAERNLIQFCESPQYGLLWFSLGWVSKDGWHPNDRGYYVFAEHICKCIELRAILPCRPREFR